MAFWGVEVRAGKPYTHSYDPDRGRLRLCQATLGIGADVKKSIVQCNVGRKSPVFLCALLPDKTESCHLDLEFEESEQVIFSVIGPRSVHLTGYYSAYGHKRILNDDSESFGEDIANSDSYNSANSSDKYEDSFIDDDDNDHEVSHFPSPGTKHKAKPKRRLIKKFRTVESDEDVSSKQEKIHTISKPSATEIEDEDEDNCVISTLVKMSENVIKAQRDTNATNDIPLTEEKNEHPTKEEKNEHTVFGINSPHSTVALDELVVTGTNGESDRRESPKEVVNETPSKAEKNEHTISGTDVLHSMVAVDELVTETNGESYRRKSPKKRKRQCDTKEERTSNDINKDGKALQHQLPNQKSLDEMDTNTTNEILLKEEVNVTPTKAEKNEHTISGYNVLHSMVAMDELVSETNDESDRRKSPKKRKIQFDTKEEMTLNVINKEDQALQHQLPNQESIGDKVVDINANSNIVGEKEPIKTKNRKMKSQTKVRNVEVEDGLSEPLTLSSGLIIEELLKGKHDGKIAGPGKKVKVFLTAKLRDTGRVFFSNIDKSALRFVIGAVDIIDGLHIGLDGMRVGDKRRLTIPPSLGFGSLGNGDNVPPDSWLVYDVELVGIRG